MKTKRHTGLLVLLILLGILSFLCCGILGWRLYDTQVDRSGWETQHDQYYYRDFHNHRVTGWQNIGSARYYFGEDGAMQTGWLTLDQELYYLDTDGKLCTGWLHHNDRDYYLGLDGAMATGLLELDGKLYLLDADGHRLTGLHTVEGNTYCFTEEGPAAAGPVDVDGHHYFFGEDFTARTGWAQRDGQKYYYLPEGQLALGMQEIDGKYYCFDRTGAARTGWVTQGEYDYYFGEDGAALTGPQTIDGQKRYFTPKGIHVVLVNASNPIPEDYDPDPVILEGDFRISRVCLKPMQKMLADCKAAGNDYAINSSYRSHEEQAHIVELRTQENMAKDMTREEAYEKTLETAAKPGTSEHEMGLAADIVGDDAKKWLAEHCWDYGFILRYPPEKSEITGIVFEPWHFRYVGKEVALDMKAAGQCLEEYLGAGPAVPETHS